jgi:RNA binding exosome subunit
LFVHGTEDSKKIFNAIQERLGIQENDLELESLRGYFGNPVISVRCHSLGAEADAIASRVFDSMDAPSRTKFRTELSKSVDEHDALYLRIDKQGLKNTISLSDEEAIHLKLKPKKRSGRDTMLKLYRALC